MNEFKEGSPNKMIMDILNEAMDLLLAYADPRNVETPIVAVKALRNKMMNALNTIADGNTPIRTEDELDGIKMDIMIDIIDNGINIENGKKYEKAFDCGSDFDGSVDAGLEWTVYTLAKYMRKR